MSKRLLTLAMTAALTLGGIGAAAAAPGDNGKGPGPNGSNNKGLCTAYFNGQKKGHDKKASPGPFAALEVAADEAGDDDASTIENVYDYCSQFGIGGNPGENGRYPSCFDGETNKDGYDCDV